MNILTFDLNLLKVLHALLAEGSTIGAARRLGLSQPAVSSALGRLRLAFGDPLFVRVGQGLEPTVFATQLKADVEQALSLATGMLSHLDAFNPNTAERNIVLSGSDFFSELLLPELLEVVRLQAPGVKIVLVDQVFETSLTALEQGKVDIAFWPEMALPKWVNSRHILTTQFEFVARSDHPRLVSAGIEDGDRIPLNLVCDLSHIHFSPDGHTLDDLDGLLAKQGRQRKIIATSPTFAGVMSVVQRSDLIGTLPTHMIDRLQSSTGVTRHPLSLQRAKIKLFMLWHRRLDNSPVQKWIRQKIIEALQ